VRIVCGISFSKATHLLFMSSAGRQNSRTRIDQSSWRRATTLRHARRLCDYIARHEPMLLTRVPLVPSPRPCQLGARDGSWVGSCLLSTRPVHFIDCTLCTGPNHQNTWQLETRHEFSGWSGDLAQDIPAADTRIRLDRRHLFGSNAISERCCRPGF
jgi:hypothetical protein